MRIRMALLVSLWACGDGSGGFTRVPARGFFQPEELDFGERPIGQPSQADVILTNSSAETLLFDTVMFEGEDGSAFAARTESGGTLRGTQLARNATLKIAILFGPSAERAYDAKMVVLSKELGIELDVRGSGRLVPPATPGLSPSTISFGSDIEIGRRVVQPIRVTNIGELTGRLTRVAAPAPFAVTTSQGGAATPSAELEPGASVDLEVSFLPTAEGPASAAIEFEMDSGAKAALAANGVAILPSVLGCDLMSIDFGAVTRGETSVRPVSCTADGPYTIETIDVPAGGTLFSAESVSPSLGSTSASWTFGVRFDAGGVAGVRTGRLELVGATGSRTTIALSGEVLAPAPGVTDLRVAMSWTAVSTDFDLHLVRAGGLPFDSDDDCHFAAKTIDWGAPGAELDDPFLDRDDTNGPGTEELNLVDARNDSYDAYVMYFDDGAYDGPAEIGIEYNLEGAAPQQFTHSMSMCGNMWHVGTFNFGSTPAIFTAGGTETDQWASRTNECR